MKKTLLMATVIISVVLNLLGCASTSKTSKEAIRNLSFIMSPVKKFVKN